MSLPFPIKLNQVCQKVEHWRKINTPKEREKKKQNQQRQTACFKHLATKVDTVLKGNA